MKKLILPILTVLTIACSKNSDNKMKAPIAEKIKKEITTHGHTRVDNYYWLNDRENPKVIEYLEAENKYTEEALAHTKPFQEKLYQEMIGRIKQDDESVPYKLNGYWYNTKFEKNKEYPILSRKKETLDATEEIYLDVNKIAEKYEYFSLGDAKVSQNNQILAYSEDVVSRRNYTIKFKNLETGENFKDLVPNTTGGIAWANDNKTIFYTKKDTTTLRAFQIYKHTLGTSVKEDVLVYQENDEQFDCEVYTSKSKDYIMIGSASTLSSEFRFLSADLPDGEFVVIQERMPNVEYSVTHFEDKFFIQTNLNAENFRLMETSVNNTTVENWKEVIPHRENVLLEGIEIFKDFLVVEERENGLPKMKVIKHQDKSEYYINFGEPAYNCWAGTNPDFNTSILRYGYTSMTTPASVIDFDMNTQTKEIKKQHEVVGGYNPEDYVTERLMATARDGVKVPISIVYKKGIEKNGKNPLLLYAYGSYGYSMDAEFSSTRLSLLDRGFVYAIAHIRGGEEMGRHWYEDGKFLKKKNTFYDFIDCAEYLISEKYTQPEKLFAMGGSAGGMLMGGIINMRPELWKGVIAAVPFVDVVTTMLDESIPLTTGEFEEWGNPKDKEYYDYMLSYSPYDNVEAKDYPNLLVTTGLHDSQVQYWEPAKWVAKLRDMKTDNNLLLLKTDMEVGHGGASGRFQRYKESAMEYAFFLDLLGIKE